MSELELQLWLAKQLKEEIEFCKFGPNNDADQIVEFRWISSRIPIHFSAWDYIARRVEEKLNDDKPWSSNSEDYPTWTYSSLLLEASGIELWDNGTYLRPPFDIALLISKLPWTTRTIALMKVIQNEAP